MGQVLKIIIDFDGTLTAEETQVRQLAEMSLQTLSKEIIGTPVERLRAEYIATRERLLANPSKYWWEVNGLIASYCDEGAFILNTTTLQVMLGENPEYSRAVAEFFPDAEYDPVVDCTNYLFHRHTAELPVAFRPGTRGALAALLADPMVTPVILTNSLGDKVKRQIAALDLVEPVAILGDTRQYEMIPSWDKRFLHPALGEIQVWPVTGKRSVDLRRPAYYHALLQASADGSSLAVVADTFSLPGALPLMMGIPFFLLRTSYTPEWCAQVVEQHSLGAMLEDVAQLAEVVVPYQND